MNKLAVFVFVFAIAVLVHIFLLEKDCNVKGGKLVRGVFWFECVKPLDKPAPMR